MPRVRPSPEAVVSRRTEVRVFGAPPSTCDGGVHYRRAARCLEPAWNGPSGARTIAARASAARFPETLPPFPRWMSALRMQLSEKLPE